MKSNYSNHRKLILVVGARPNFIKAAPLMVELRRHSDMFETLLVHTGQHYDYNLSQLFFEQLKMPRPNIDLGIGSGSHSQQTAKIMIELERVFAEHEPDLVIVFGDVNSTLAGSLVAAKMSIPIAHVEAGLRSFDMSMPEEINRIVTDRLSDLCFVSENSGIDNLLKDGIGSEKLFLVGNIMIDSLKSHLAQCAQSSILDSLHLKSKEYAVITLHRPSNVDDREILTGLLNALNEIAGQMPLIFPCHPRTKKEMNKFGLFGNPIDGGIRILEPLGYIDFLRLQSEALFVLTDSGGIQEETTYLKIPCITLRYNTERPVTVEIGSNILTGPEPKKIKLVVDQILNGSFKNSQIPPFWDGATAARITDILLKKLGCT
jgi:UDP-N-acetylglucosamine 2-epimerase (non-hydrolysing)